MSQPARRPEEDEVHAVALIYSDAAATYDAHYLTDEALAEDDVTRALIRGLRVEHPGAVLDVGCGTGLAIRLGEIEPDGYLGIDPSWGMLDQARALHPEHRFIETHAAAMNGIARSFTLALALYGVLNYVPDLDAALRSIARRLYPGSGLLAHTFLPSRMEHDDDVPIAARWARVIPRDELDAALSRAGYTVRANWRLTRESDHEVTVARRG